MEDWLTDRISNPTSILAAIAVIALLWHGARWTQRMEAGQQTFRDGLKELGDGLKELGDGLKELGDGLKELGDGLKELGDRMDAQRALLEERIEKESRTLRDEVRNQQSGNAWNARHPAVARGRYGADSGRQQPAQADGVRKADRGRPETGEVGRRRSGFGRKPTGSNRSRSTHSATSTSETGWTRSGGARSRGQPTSSGPTTGRWATSSASCCATRCWRLRTPDRTRRKPPD